MEVVQLSLRNLGRHLEEVVAEPLNPMGPFRLVNAVRSLPAKSAHNLSIEFAPRGQVCELVWCVWWWRRARGVLVVVDIQRGRWAAGKAVRVWCRDQCQLRGKDASMFLLCCASTAPQHVYYHTFLTLVHFTRDELLRNAASTQQAWSGFCDTSRPGRKSGFGHGPGGWSVATHAHMCGLYHDTDGDAEQHKHFPTSGICTI